MLKLYSKQVITKNKYWCRVKMYMLRIFNKPHSILKQYNRDAKKYHQFSINNLKKLEAYYSRQYETKKLFLTYYTIVFFSVFVSSMASKLYHLSVVFFYNIFLHQGVSDISEVTNSAQFLTKILFLLIVIIVLSFGIQMIWNINDVMRKRDVISLEIKMKENNL